MSFNLDNYMTAEQRIELFAADNPDMRQESFKEVIDGVVYVTVKLYRTWADPHPWVYGLSGESTKTQFAVEKAETSAYARAITNTGLPKYSTTVNGTKAPRANRAEMERVAETPKTIYGRPNTRSAALESVLRESFTVETKESEPTQWTVGEVVDAIGTQIPNPPPECQHGHTLKQGISKGGKPYYGYVCKGNVKEDAVWASMSPNGRWYFKGDE